MDQQDLDADSRRLVAADDQRSHAGRVEERDTLAVELESMDGWKSDVPDRGNEPWSGVTVEFSADGDPGDLAGNRGDDVELVERTCHQLGVPRARWRQPRGGQL